MTSNQPQTAHTMMIGCIQATIWQHDTSFGVQHTVTVCRLDPVNDEIIESTSFNRGDLPIVARVLDEAYIWLVQRQAADTVWAPRMRADPEAKRQGCA